MSDGKFWLLPGLELSVKGGYDYRKIGGDNFHVSYDVRSVIQRLGLDEGRQYAFFRSMVNPKVDKVLRENASSIYNQRHADKKYSIETLDDICFNPSLRELFLKVTDNIMNDENIVHDRYFPIRSENVMVVPVNVPVIHVIAGNNDDDVLCAREILCSRLTSYSHTLSKLIAPQNYHKEEIECISKSKLSPFIIDERTLKLKGRQIIDFMDLLYPFIVVENKKIPLIDQD